MGNADRKGWRGGNEGARHDRVNAAAWQTGLPGRMMFVFSSLRLWQPFCRCCCRYRQLGGCRRQSLLLFSWRPLWFRGSDSARGARGRETGYGGAFQWLGQAPRCTLYLWAGAKHKTVKMQQCGSKTMKIILLPVASRKGQETSSKPGKKKNEAAETLLGEESRDERRKEQRGTPQIADEGSALRQET